MYKYMYMYMYYRKMLKKCNVQYRTVLYTVNLLYIIHVHTYLLQKFEA